MGIYNMIILFCSDFHLWVLTKLPLLLIVEMSNFILVDSYLLLTLSNKIVLLFPSH